MLLGESGRLKGLPETINVPETMLDDIHNVSSACARILQGYHLATFAHMGKVVVAQSENLQELDRLWVLEENFLVHHARRLGMEKVRQQLLDALSDESRPAQRASRATFARWLSCGALRWLWLVGRQRGTMWNRSSGS